jgi:secreted trypsin-like serine protease
VTGHKWGRVALIGLAAFVAWAMTGQASAIVTARAATADDERMAAVVRVEADRGLLDRGLACTGTLIAARWVLTAQHCTNAGGRPGHPYQARDIRVRLDDAGWAVTAVRRMAGYDARSLVNDVALLELAEPMTAVTPARIASAPLPAASSAEVYGFGGTPVQHAAGVRVTSLAAVNDGPCLFPDPPSLTFVTSVRGGSSQGDSGGPMFTAAADGVPVLQTVTAGAADRQTCGSPDLHQRPQAWVGIYNRVDRASEAWSFLAQYLRR